VFVASTHAVEQATGETGAVTGDASASTDTSCDVADQSGVPMEAVKSPEKQERCAERWTGRPPVIPSRRWLAPPRLMSPVYLAGKTALCRRVVIKILPPSWPMR
jgi:hypothetical protein